jgi:F-type H+-transporting ATPase subunit a
MQKNPAASASPDASPDAGIDGAFLRRVYIMSAIVAVLGGVLASQRLGGSWGLGFFLYAIWSTANLWALEQLLRLVVRPSGRQPLAILVASTVKLPLLYGLGAWIALSGDFPATALMAGFSVPLAVIVLKTVGRLAARRFALPVGAALCLIALPALAQHGDDGHAEDAQAVEQHADEQEADDSHGAAAEHGEAPAHGAADDGHGAAEGEDHGDGHAVHGEHIELPHFIMALRGIPEIGLVPHADKERAAAAGGYLSGSFGFGDVVHVFENTFFSLLAAIFLSVVAVRIYNNRQMLPGRLQAMAEIVVEQVEGTCTTIMGHHGRHYAPFVGTIFVYLLCMNYSGLIPLGKASTSTFLNNISIALCVFLYVQYTGMRKNGFLGWLHHLCGSPKDVVGWALSPLMLFLEVFGELIKPISLSLRLFGNIFGEDMLLAIFALLGVILLAPLGSPVGIPLHLPFMMLSLLLGFIQAMVFSLLSAVYISMMLPHDEHH